MIFTSQLTIVEADNAGISVPERIVVELGDGHRPKVQLTLNGFTYRSSIAKYGDEYWIPVSKARRTAGQLDVDVPYEIEINLDTAPRVVELPEELARHFETTPASKITWETLSYSSQLQLVTPILSAKKPETRQRNIDKVIAQLSGA